MSSDDRKRLLQSGTDLVRSRSVSSRSSLEVLVLDLCDIVDQILADFQFSQRRLTTEGVMKMWLLKNANRVAECEQFVLLWSGWQSEAQGMTDLAIEAASLKASWDRLDRILKG